MTALLTFLGGWQLKVFLVLFLLFGGYTWHKVQVHKAVIQATTELQLKHSKEVFRQVELARNETIKLRQEKEKLDNDYKKSMAAANAKLRDMDEWLRNIAVLNSSTINPGSTGVAEGRPEDIIGELPRQNALDLAQYGADAEQMRQGLILCYKQYDDVKEKLDSFRLNNTPKTD